ncbi:unnamed protein product [Calypogeia fissa]
MKSGHMLAVEDLYLGRANMGDEGCEAYASATSTGKLPSLSISGFLTNSAGDSDSFQVGRNNNNTVLPKLEHLHLSHNYFNWLDSFAQAISSDSLNSLKHLDLSFNNIGDKGLKELADSFQTEAGNTIVLPNLQSLNLSRNPFTEVGLLSLAKAFSSGSLSSLRALSLKSGLFNFSISHEAARALVSALSELKHLVEVCSDLDYEFPALERLQNQFIERNKRMSAILEGLEGSPVVPATFSKVYICGDPEVGKTTLRKTLERSFWESFFCWATRPHVEQRTRGIDVSVVTSKGDKSGEDSITFLVWDMAGHHEYHLLHKAFLPNLSSAKGKASSFIIVCSARTSLVESKKQLIYWLQFIASSCGDTTGNLRNVFVVVNNIGGHPKVRTIRQNLKQFIDNQREDFKGYFEISIDPFFIDVRKYKSVQGLRKNLLDHARKLLRGVTVPEICQFIEKNLHAWSKARRNFPVLQWNEFAKEVQEKSTEPWTEEKLEAATRFLNKAGVLVYISVPSNSSTAHRRLVVLNPNWFCKEIAGKMFLHQDMVNPKEPLFRKYVDHNGSISRSEFKEFFRYSGGEWNDSQFEDLLAILLWSGLCYQGRDQRLYIPALIVEKRPIWDHNHAEDQ